MPLWCGTRPCRTSFAIQTPHPPQTSAKNKKNTPKKNGIYVPIAHPTAASLNLGLSRSLLVSSLSLSLCAAGSNDSTSDNRLQQHSVQHNRTDRSVSLSSLLISSLLMLWSPKFLAVSRHLRGLLCLGGLAQPDARVSVVEHGVVLALNNEKTLRST